MVVPSFGGTQCLEIGCAHVAQSVEHVLGKDEVTGSSPVMGSKTDAKTGN